MKIDHPISTLMVIAIVAAVYLAAAKLGLSLAFVNASATAVWPPTGIALAALLVLGYRVLPGILLGAFLANLTITGLTATTIGIAAGNALEALAGAWLVKRLARGLQVFERAQDIFKFAVLAGIVSPMVSATIGVTSLVLGGFANWADSGSVWLTWWLGDATGDIIVAPVLILWALHPRPGWNARQWLEAVLLLVVLVFLGLAVYGGLSPIGFKTYPLQFLIFPILVWFAFRFTQREVATAALIISGIAIWGTLTEWSHLPKDSQNELLLLLQSFMSVVAITGIVLAALVSERKRAEEALERRVEEQTRSLSTAVKALQLQVTERMRAEEKFRGLLESAPDAMVIVDSDGKIRIVNTQVDSLFGYSREELIGQSVEMLIPERYRAKHFNHRTGYVRNAKARAMGAGLELAGLRKDGSEFPVDISLSPLETEEGTLVTAAVRDITERKRTEALLQKSEESLVEAQRSAHIGSWEWDIPTNTVTWSDEMFRRYGLEPQSIPLDYGEFLKRVPPEDRQMIDDAVQHSYREHSPFEFDHRVVWRDGSIHWLHARGNVVVDESGNPTRMFGTGQDIDERQRIEAERARRTKQLQALADASLMIHSAPSLDVAIKAVAKHAREIIGAHQSFAIFVPPTPLSKGGNRGNAIHHISLSDKYAAYQSNDAKPDGSEIYPIVLTDNRPMRLTQAELQAHPSWRDFARFAVKHPPLRGWLAVPMIGREGCSIGQIHVSDKYDGEFTEDDEAILVELANVASVAIENAQLLQEVRASRESLRMLSNRLVDSQENERRHIARELHDELGQTLTGLKMELETAARLSSDVRRETLFDALSQVSELLSQVRSLSQELRPAVLDDLGLMPALLSLIERYNAQTQIQVDLKQRGLEDQRFPSNVETTVYRIVQEALTNVARYAEVNKASVRVWADSQLMHVHVEDQGVGFDPEAALAAGASSGLVGMRERALLLGGQLELESAPGNGTRITAELPLHPV